MGVIDGSGRGTISHILRSKAHGARAFRWVIVPVGA